jgi:hydrogenase nickel incorporation protein HypA/HybF
MHEASIAAGILDAARDALRDHPAARLRRVRVRIGRLAGVVPECLSFAWEVMREGTMAEGAALAIDDVPVTARCRSCDHSYGVEDLDLACRRCGGLDVEMLTGRELTVVELELEEEAVQTGGTT